MAPMRVGVDEKEWRKRRVKRHRKPRKFVIECRYPESRFAGWSGWHVWKRYETKERRDKALSALRRSKSSYVEFRAE